MQQPLYLALLCFSFPVKSLMTYVFASKTKNKYKFRMEELFDLAICAVVFVWLTLFFIYSREESPYPKIAHTKVQVFMYQVLLDTESGKLRFDYLLAAMAASFWLRVIFMLRLTKTFGPLIRIIEAMLRELGIFLVLWFIQLFVFACIATILFGEIEKYDKFFNVFIDKNQSIS